VVLRDAGIHAAAEDWSALRGLLWRAGRFALSIGVVLALLLIAAVFILIPAESAELRLAFFIGAFLLPLQSLSSIRASALLALGRVWSGLSPDYLLRPIVLGLCVLTMVWLLHTVNAVGGMVAAIGAGMAALVLGQVLLMRALPAAQGPTSTPERQHFLRSAWSLMLFNGSSQLLYQVDTIIVGATIHPHEAGKYYAAKQLALVASLALIALQTTAAPRLAALWANRELAGLQLELRRVALRGFAFSLLYVVFCLLFGKLVLGLFGPAFVEAYPVLIILAIGQLIAAAGGAVGQIAAMAGLQTIGGSIYLVAAGVLALTAPVLIDRFGVPGAALTSLIVTFSWIVGLNIIVWRKLQDVSALLPIRRHPENL
jgi:O-antigen/teichoic acid export membrane protein